MIARVAVLGNGVIGLLTAKRLQDLGHQVVVVGADEPRSTTSAAAGGVVLPFFPFDPRTPEFRRRMDWARSSAALYRGLSDGRFWSTVPHAEFSRGGLLEESFPLTSLPDAELEDVEVVRLDEPVDGFDEYVKFTLNCIDTLGILDELSRLMIERGGEHQVCRLDENTIRRLPVDHVFNCLGFGGARLFQDPDVLPVFGQALRYPPVGARFGVGIGDYVALSMQHSLYIGSLFVRNRDERAPSGEFTRRLWEFTRTLLTRTLELIGSSDRLDLPFPAAPQVITGVRPFRQSGVRVAAEEFGDKLVVHNYGHGAHGWTVGWGSVIHAVELWEKAGGASGHGRRPRADGHDTRPVPRTAIRKPRSS